MISVKPERNLRLFPHGDLDYPNCSSPMGGLKY